MIIKSMRALFAITAVLSFYAWGQSPTAYDNAVKLYKGGKYDSTITYIRNYLKKNGKSDDAQVMVPLIVESMVRKGDIASTKRLFEMYRQKYESSPYIPRMRYLEGVVDAREGHYREAIGLFSGALEGGVSKSLDSMIIANADKVCGHGLTEEELSATAASKEIDPRLREIASFYDIVKLYGSSEVTKGRSLAEEFRKTYPHSYYEPQLRD